MIDEELNQVLNLMGGVALSMDNSMSSTKETRILLGRAIDRLRNIINERKERGMAGMMDEKERQIAVREAAMITASDDYFNARPQIDDNHSRRVFEAGFERGHKQGYDFKAVVTEELQSMGLYKPEHEFDANKAIATLVGARMRSGAPFDDVCNMVARDLPSGWQIEVDLELGSGSVTLYDNSGKTFSMSPDFSMQEKVEAALRVANGGEE